MVVMLAFGCTKTDESNSSIGPERTELHYRNLFAMPLDNKQILSDIDGYISSAKKTNDDLGEAKFKIIDGNKTYVLHEKGFVVDAIKYLYDEDLSPLYNQLYVEFTQINKIDLKDLENSSLRITFKDLNQSFTATDSLFALIKDELAYSAALQDPPMIYGIPYPFLELTIKERMILRWVSPAIVAVELDGHSIGDIQLSSTKIWDQLKELYPDYFTRTGIFDVDAVIIEYGESQILVDNQYNRLDNLLRMFSSLEKSASKPNEESDPQPIIIRNPLDYEPIYMIYPDHTILYNGETYTKENIYEEIIGFLSVP